MLGRTNRGNLAFRDFAAKENRCHCWNERHRQQECKSKGQHQRDDHWREHLSYHALKREAGHKHKENDNLPIPGGPHHPPPRFHPFPDTPPPTNPSPPPPPPI